MLMNLILDGARAMICKPENSALARSQGSDEPVLDSRKIEGFIPKLGRFLPLLGGNGHCRPQPAACFSDIVADIEHGSLLSSQLRFAFPSGPVGQGRWRRGCRSGLAGSASPQRVRHIDTGAKNIRQLL